MWKNYQERRAVKRKVLPAIHEMTTRQTKVNRQATVNAQRKLILGKFKGKSIPGKHRVGEFFGPDGGKLPPRVDEFDEINYEYI